MCKEVGASLAAQQHRHLLANTIAVELGLDEPNGPSAVLLQAMEALGDHAESKSTNVVYMYLLDACEKVFDSELDQTTFEEHMRWFFGNKVIRFLVCFTFMLNYMSGLPRIYSGQSNCGPDQAGPQVLFLSVSS